MFSKRVEMGRTLQRCGIACVHLSHDLLCFLRGYISSQIVEVMCSRCRDTEFPIVMRYSSHPYPFPCDNTCSHQRGQAARERAPVHGPHGLREAHRLLHHLAVRPGTARTCRPQARGQQGRCGRRRRRGVGLNRHAAFSVARLQVMHTTAVFGNL